MAERPEKKDVEVVKHDNIHAALSAFQGELKPMERSGKVEYPTRDGKTVSFTYTPLSKIMEVIYPILAKHGLAIRHEVTKEGVEAILTHATYTETTEIAQVERAILGTGQKADTEIETRVRKTQNELRSGPVKITYGASDMKDTGAAITYARRYSLTMLLGISSEEDKDAELLAESAENAQSFVMKRAKKGIDDAKTVEELDKATAVLTKDMALLGSGKAPSLGMTKEQYESLLAAAEARKKELSAKPA